MRPEVAILHEAANLKIALQKRAVRIKELHVALAAWQCHTAPDLKPDRIETMQRQLQRAVALQAREAIVYAALRWVLCGSGDINENDLDL